jgi:ligand-binding SRPBCC domain-containing protein
MAEIFETESWVPAPIERVFRFFSDPHNLTAISPPSSGARLKSLHLVPPRVPDVQGTEQLAGAGSEIVLSIRLLPYFPVRGSWTAKIIEYQWLDHFRDVQVRGPFKKFEHTHSFLPERRGRIAGTVVRDHVEYDVGFGPLGILANALLVRSMLRQMFAFRQTATERAFS